MAFDSAVDAVDWMLWELPWKQEGNKLVLDGLPRVTARQLIKKPGVYDRIALLVRQAGLEMALLRCPGMKKGFPVFAAAADSNSHTHEKAMTEQSTLSDIQAQDYFIWFGGVITPDLRNYLLRMEESPTPTGILQPVNEGGVIKTVQWGINSAAVRLFNYDALSLDDMKSAIQRDTTGDWFPEDLEEKRKLYQQAGDSFEQVARIQIKSGWMLVRFHTQRIGVGNLVMSTGQQESEIVERPELLVTV